MSKLNNTINDIKTATTNTASKIGDAMKRVIKSNNNGTAVSELVAQSDTVQKPKKALFVKEDNFIQIDMKRINGEAMADTLELQGIEESFIPELDTNQANEFADMLEQRIMDLSAEASKYLVEVAEKVNSKYSDVLMKTEWNKGNVQIKTKYFFTENGLYMQQVTHRGTVTTYKSGVPTIHGLVSYRAELANNEELDFEELRAIHNAHVLNINGLLAEDEATYRDLAEVDESNKRRANFNSKDRRVWIQYFDGFIQMIQNKNVETEVKKAVKTPTERIADLMNNSDLF